MSIYRNHSWIGPVLSAVLALLLLPGAASAVDQWGRFETTVTNSQSYGDPYRDVTLNVTYTAPNGSTVNFWGFYDGGQTWKLRFMPHQPGTWQYHATFSDGSPGKSGSFVCVASGGPATIRAHAANPRWFGQADGKPFLVRSFHAAGLFKFSVDDPANPNDGEKRAAFLDWAQAQGYNTLSAHFFSTRDATDSVGPKLWPLNDDHFRKVEMILEDLSDRGMAAYAFTGFFGNSGPYPSSSADRTLYIRYCLARFAPYWNIIMNVGGFEVRDYLSDTVIRSLGAEIAAANPFGHLLGAHQRDGDDIFRNDAWCSFATLQHELTSLSSLSSYLLANYAGKPVYGQETLWVGNALQPAWTLTDLRKHMWVHMMSAAAYNAADMNGDNESGFGGSLDLAHKIQARHDVPKRIWDFMESIPFHTMVPRQDLRSTGYMLAEVGQRYLCYLPSGGSVNIAVAGGTAYNVTWINAQNPLGDQRSGGTTSNGQGLAAPDSNDWLVYLTATGSGGGTNGLTAEYFNNADLTQLVLTRTDPTVNFGWGTGSPDPAVGADTFSVRWAGYLLPAHASGAATYTFRTSTNDGVRLWVGGQLLVDDWTNGPLRTNSASISLQAGHYYPIDMEFYENTQTAEARLTWQSTQLAQQIIPQAQLFTVPPNVSNGLTAVYFNNADLTQPVLTRIDPTVDFVWGTGSPNPAVGADTFSVRWTGYLIPAHASGAATYTFRTSTNDGVRLRVGGQLLINDWTNGPLRTNSASISLDAGYYHAIEMEFYENTHTAEAHLTWESTQLPQQVIPQAQLFTFPVGP